MTIKEIRDNIFREDKMKACTACVCSEKYVNYILSGDRNAETEKAKEILDELERLATINQIANGEKNKRIVEAGRILFSKPQIKRISITTMKAA